MMTAPPVPLKTRVLVRMDGRAGARWKVYTPFDAYGSIEYLEMPWCRDREQDPDSMTWWPLPALDDPRWRAGEPSGGVEGEPILVRYGDSHDRVFEDDYSNNRSLPFPGFAGGPMYRFQGVKSWMPISTLGPGHGVHPDVIKAETPIERQIRERTERVYRLAEAVQLAVLNDGYTYRRTFQQLAEGGKVRWDRKTAGFAQWDDIQRRAVLVNWTYKGLMHFTHQNPDVFGDETISYGDRCDACRLAARAVLDHYYRSWKERP